MRKLFNGRRAVRLLVTLAVSASGGIAAQFAGLPAAWIAGGLIAVAAVSLAGFNTEVPVVLRPPVYLVLGILSGSGVSSETLDQMATWPLSFALLALSLVGVVAGSYRWLHGACGWDRNSALLASMPGALSFVLAAAEDLKVDMKKVAIAQCLRLVILVELIPLLALAFDHTTGAPPIRSDPASMSDLALLLTVGAISGLAATRLALPAGWLIGGLVGGAALHLTAAVEGSLPGFLAVPSMVALGAITGSRFRPGDLLLLGSIAWPALVAFAIAAAVSSLGAAVVSLIFGIGIIQTLLAFAPGAVEVLIIIAFEIDADPAYVAAHHVARLFVLVAAVPLLARWLERRR